MRIGFVSLSWTGGFDGQFAVAQMNRTRELLATFGEVVGPLAPLSEVPEARQAAAELQAGDIDILILQQGTFCSAEPLPILVERLQAPIILWALEEPFDGGPVVANSLCGVQLMASVLYRLERRYDCLYGDPAALQTQERLGVLLTAARMWARLKRVRVGLAGSRAPGFYPLDVDELLLRRVIGPELVHLDLSEIFFGIEPSAAQLQEAEADLLDHVHNAAAMPPVKLTKVARAVAVFRQIVARHDLDCVAVKCWPEFLDGYGVAACTTLSRLGSGGMVAGCEGDVNGTLTSFILQELRGQQPTFLADLIKIDAQSNTGMLWHCGVAPIEMAAPAGAVNFGTEFGGVGMNLEFALKPGRVTIARLGAARGRYRLLVTSGEALSTPLLAKGTMALVRFDPSVEDLLARILQDGWEHHVSMVYGDVAEELAALGRMLGIEVERVGG